MKILRTLVAGTTVLVALGIVSTAKMGIDTRRNAPPSAIAMMGPVAPGPTDNRITQTNIHETICASGWSKKVRPSSAYTGLVKRLEMGNGGDVQSPAAAGRIYHVVGTHLNQSLRLYELDHNVPIEVAGNEEDPVNLKLQLWDGPDGARAKDRAENKVHALVCSGAMRLVDGQQVFLSGNWKQYAN
jgi:hypothetical protein